MPKQNDGVNPWVIDGLCLTVDLIRAFTSNSIIGTHCEVVR